MPIALQSLIFPFANLIIQSSINSTGSNNIAAWALCGKLDFLVFLIADSIAGAIATYVAQNHGAKKEIRIKKGIKAGLVISTVPIICLSILLFLFCGSLAKIFIRPSDYDVIPSIINIIRFISPFYFFYSTAELFSGVMKGKGKTFMAMIISIFSACVIRIFWIAFIDTMNNHSILLILACYPISWFVSILLYTTFDRVPQKEKIQD